MCRGSKNALKLDNSEQYWSGEMCSFLFINSVTNLDIIWIIFNRVK